MKKNIEVENQVGKFEISLDSKELKPYIDTAVDAEIAELEVDGFRKGKMPKAMFLSKYGVESVYNKVIDTVLNEVYPQLIMENKLDVIDNPQIDFEKLTIDEKKGMNVSGSVQLFPIVNVEGYDKHKDSVKKDTVKVVKKDVDQQIKNLLNDKAVVEVSDKPAKDGDTLIIDFEGSVDGELFDGGSAQNHELVLGSNSFIPGYEEQLIGAKEGDVVEVKVTFPTEYHAADLAGKEAVFKTTVHEVKITKVPKLTDKLAKDIQGYEVKTAEELTTKIEEELKVQKTEQALNKYNYDVLSKLIKSAKLDVPQAMIDREVEGQIGQMKQQLQSQGIEFDMYLQMMGGDLQTIKDQITPEATRRIEEYLVIDAVVKAEKYEVTDKEADERVKELMDQNSMSKEEVINALGGDLNRLKENIAYDKAYKLVLGA